MRTFSTVAISGLAIFAIGSSPTFARATLSDAQIKQRVIQESIAEYPGNCPCPYNSARNGSSCGGRSAWSRAGGYSPKCYARDVTAAEVREYRRKH